MIGQNKNQFKSNPQVQAISVAASLGNMHTIMNYTTNTISLLLLIISSAGPAIINKVAIGFFKKQENFPPCWRGVHT